MSAKPTGQVFFSMELVQGEDLATLLRRVGRLPSEKVVEIARQLCAGLAAAHAQGVLHRDLKPANVLIDDDGRVRITDFGIATTDGGTVADARRHAGYMAPEQLDAGASLSERTDLYALGLVLYELRRRPASVDVSRAPAAPPPRPSALVPDVDPQLERVIMQALAADPRDRPASAARDGGGACRADRRRPAGARRWWLRRRRRWSAGRPAMLALVAVARTPRATRAR